ncbi:MAG: condensation domain-containing protein, partial [Acidobacteriota bacterium]|nr:condensation domain-containing protein [Acidobacteriota bacterium]
LDRKALPDARTGVLAGSGEYEPPVGEVEEKISEVWRDLLGLDRVGRHDNFFELGGHSLLATRLASRIGRDLEVEVSIREIFANPTVASQAKLMRDRAPIVFTPIVRIEEAADYELSHAQRRLWILDRMGDKTAYSMPAALRLTGALDVERLEEAFRVLIRRHESLRTSFIEVEGEPRQVVSEEVEFRIERHDVSRKGEEEKRGTLSRIEAESASRPFDLERAPLLRVGIVRVDVEEHLLFFNMHHIVSDGWSIGVLLRELAAILRGEDPGELPIQYKDYAAWHNGLMESDRLGEERAYWLERLSGEIPALDLPADFPRPAVRSSRGSRIGFRIPSAVAGRLQELGRPRGATLFMTLTAIVKVLLYRHTGQEEIIVGTPIAGRRHSDLESQVGFYVNTLVLRDEVRGGEGFAEILDRVRETATEAYDNQDYPFDRLVEELDLRRDLSRNPLFDVMVILQNNEDAVLEMEGVEVNPFETEFAIAKFDLTFSFVESGDGIECGIEYCADLFKRERIERMAVHLQRLAESASSNPDETVGRLEMVAEEERARILELGEGPRAEYPSEKTISELFEEQVERTPDSVAVVFGERE